MKRFHVHLRVNDLQRNISFYSLLFSAKPDLVEKDYAKWMLEDPRINFALSTHGQNTGVHHLGIEIDNAQEFEAFKQQRSEAFIALSKEQPQTMSVSNLTNKATPVYAEQQHAKCCYAQSEKQWVLDPQQVPWELFHSFDTLNTYGISDTQQTIIGESINDE